MAIREPAALGADPLRSVPSSSLVVTGIVSVQFGAALATTLFHRAGTGGTVLLRLATASVVLVLLWRPTPWSLSRRQLGLACGFGVVLAVMNLALYGAISRIPLGIGVAIEFLGPLSVALGHSRRRRDLLWAAFAAAGVLALTRGSTHGLDLAGVALALLAGAAWAAYILVNARMGQAFGDGSGTAVAMCVALVIALPFGITQGGDRLLAPHVLAVGAAVGILSSAIPYTLEMEALRRISPGVFGILMSLEPAVAALAGFLVLGQGLALRELAGIALVALASAGSSLSARRAAAVAID